MSDADSTYDSTWLQNGQGQPPTVQWAFRTDGTLASFCLARETGEVFLCDESAGIYRLNRRGKVAAVNQLRDSLRLFVCSDDGQWSYAVSGDRQVLRLDRNLQIDWDYETEEDILSLACSPFGHHLLITTASATNILLNERKRKIARFETIKPLHFSNLCGTEPVVIGAAENGLLCCHNLAGAQLWQERVWTNVGSMSVTGSGDIIYLANFGHGVNAYDGDGVSLGAYVLEGTVDRVASSYEPYRLVASTIEQYIYWLNSDGEMLWSSEAPCSIVDVACDPLGEWAIVGLQSGDLMRLGWGV